jgi:hypothetical protein
MLRTDDRQQMYMVPKLTDEMTAEGAGCECIGTEQYVHETRGTGGSRTLFSTIPDLITRIPLSMLKFVRHIHAKALPLHQGATFLRPCGQSSRDPVCMRDCVMCAFF